MKKLLFTFILSVVFWINSNGQVVVTPGVFPFMCQGNGFVTQTSPIVIAEQSVNGFQTATAGTYICYEINAPANYQFKAGVGTVTFHLGSDVTAVHSLATDITANYMLFYYECPTNTKFDTIRISGLQMRALSGATSSATLLKAVGCDYMTGNYYSDAQSHGALSSTSNPAPTITYSPDPYYCSADNTPYALTGTPSGGTFSGTGVTGNNFNPFGLSAGSDIITYTVNNGGGCSNSSTLSLTVKATPTISILSNDADNIVCPSTSVTFTATASGSNQRYQFLKNGIPVTTLSTTNTYTTTTLANNDQISVEADNGNFTCQNTSSAITMTVTANPNATISVPTLPALKCSNDNTSYPISINPTGLGTITGNGVSGGNFIISSANIGTNTITYNVVVSGCSFPATTNITVTQAPSVILNSSDADNIICKGDLVTYTANTTGPVSRYDFKIGGSSALYNPQLSNILDTNGIINGNIVYVIVDNGNNTSIAG